jgi:pyrroline-5-carboxylate reductase
MMDAATAISGSGPGYYFDIVESHQKEYKDNPNKILKDFINSLAEAAEGIGFSKEEARLLAMNTGPASQLLLEKTKLSPQDLKKQITSKGGTTEAGLEVLHKGGSLIEAVKAALKRAKELSKK